MKKIRPLSNRILVRRSKALTTKGGIFLPDTAQEKPKEGEVIAMGPGRRNEDGTLEPMNLKEGDRVLYSSYAGTEVKSEEDDAEYLIMSQDDVLGVLV